MHMKAHHIKTPCEVKAEFARKGKSISSWAKENGFVKGTVFSILNGNRPCRIGESHKIAVMLGLKEGEIAD